MRWEEGEAIYDRIGRGYGDRAVTAVEPSAEMIAQRPTDAAPAVQASAEELPFEDDSFDAAMAIVSDHHWSDRVAGMREMLRVARRRVLVLNADPGRSFFQAYWRRPRAYLERSVREGISVFHRLPAVEVSAAMESLRRDLDEGRWAERVGRLRELTELDVGLRLVVAPAVG